MKFSDYLSKTMIFFQKSSKRRLTGLLNMDPMPVIKRENIPSSSSATTTCNCAYHKKTKSNYWKQKGEEIMDYSQLDDDLKCAICSEFFIEATTLCCSHTFCKYCIERWRETNTECPICRSQIDFQVHTLVLDHIIDKVLKNRTQEIRNQRHFLIKERNKDLNIRQQCIQKPVHTVQYTSALERVNILDSLLEVLNENGSPSGLVNHYFDSSWGGFDDPGFSSDEYDNNYTNQDFI